MNDFSDRTDAQIDQRILNHEAQKATGTALYRELVEERARRAQRKTGLQTANSLALLRTAAIEQRCVAYGDIAQASGVPWKQARPRMNGPQGHLDLLLYLCFVRSLPLLPALIVNQGGLELGNLEEAALRGFSEGCRRLGMTVTDEAEFHHACRDACWEWGRSQDAVSPPEPAEERQD